MGDATIFSLFAPLLDKLGITQPWIAATALNVMTLTGTAKARFPQLTGFWPTTALVAASTGLLAAAEYYTNPLAIFVAVVVIWAGTTLTMKGGEVTVAGAQKVTGFNKPPSTNPGEGT